MSSWQTRRTFLVAVAGLLAGCSDAAGDGEANNQDDSGGETTTVATPTPTETPTQSQCQTTDPDTPTDVALRRYANVREDIGNIYTSLGTEQDLKVDSVFGETTLDVLLCTEDDIEAGAKCQNEYLDAIEQLQGLRGGVKDALAELRDLREFVVTCEVQESELILDNVDGMIQNTEDLLFAIKKFIESAKRHFDNEISPFQMGDPFREGWKVYTAEGEDTLSAEELRQRVEVYN